VTSAEDGAGCLAFFRDLVARGLSGVSLVTSDAHRGLVEAIGATLPGAASQRCRTHFAANLMSATARSAWGWVKAFLHSVYDPTPTPYSPRSTGSSTRWPTSFPPSRSTSMPPEPTSWPSPPHRRRRHLPRATPLPWSRHRHQEPPHQDHKPEPHRRGGDHHRHHRIESRNKIA
jgi:hypothetical protein